MNNEIQNHPPHEILTQILVNQELLLKTAIKFVTPHCADKDRESWLSLNHALVDEYHRTRELTGEEYVGQFWKSTKR